MLAFTQPRVVADVATHVAALDSATFLLNGGGMGPTSINMKTHLLASYSVACFADLLVKRAGSGFVQHMASVAEEQRNPARLGWAFELGFFVETEQAVRQRRSVQVKVCGTGNDVESWPATRATRWVPLSTRTH
jgi:hypothetical protein